MIDSFENEHEFLSNFYPSPLHYRFRQWPTVEHAYQAAKTPDHEQQEAILNASTPGQAKRLGQQVTLRQEWEDMKVGVMYHIVSLKFGQNYELRDRLLATGDVELIEGNGWGDNFWGQIEESGWNGQIKWQGENWLGRILMLVRSEACMLRTMDLY